MLTPNYTLTLIFCAVGLVGLGGGTVLIVSRQKGRSAVGLNGPEAGTVPR